MPIKPENKKRYPKNWKEIRAAILKRANNCCENQECLAKNGEPHPVTGSIVVLTVAHLDHTPENCAFDNLRAWCQKDHNKYDAKHRAANAKITREKRRMSNEVESINLRPATGCE